MIALLLLAVGVVAPSCHTITSDHILAADLAQALPAFSSVSKEQVVGLSPFPGQQRVFRQGELRRLAMTNGLTQTEFTEPVCFAWPMVVPSLDVLRSAMKKSLDGRRAEIEIMEQSMTPLPPGELTFPLQGLSGTSDGPVLWRGVLTYADKKTLNLWARVKVTVHEPHLVANEVLKPGEEVRSEQLHVQNYDGPLLREQPFTAVNQVIGMTARNSVAAGMALTRELLRARNDVERGDLVQVLVELNQTHLEAQGVAEESGQIGALISIRNARSGRRFRARIEAKGKVLVQPQGPTGLVVEESRHDASN